MAIKVLVVDDEKPARRRLASLLSGIPEIELIGEAETGAVAVTLVERHRPDILLLDVQMPGMNGFQVLEHLSYVPEVIFVTAWDQYALRAFEVSAVDYLLKPYSRERLLRSLEKAVRSLRDSVDRRAQILMAVEQYRVSRETLTKIPVRSGSATRFVEAASTACFHAEAGMVFLHTAGEKLLVDDTLQHLEERLDPSLFVRIHKNAIVNRTFVQQINPISGGRYEIRVGSALILEVSRHRASAFRTALGIGATRGRRSGVDR